MADGRSAKHVVLHVGPHKTGSTFIQAALNAAAPALEAGSVWRPPDYYGPDGSPSQYMLPKLIRARDTAALAPRFAEILAAPASRIVLSTEDFSLLSEDDVRYFAGFLGTARVTVVFVWRPLPDLLRSMWQETIRHGAIRTFPEFVADRLLDPFRDGAVNPCVRIDPWTAVFGLEAVRILSYPDIVGSGRSLFDAFLEAGALPAVAAAPAEVHVSPPAALSEVSRALNAIAGMRDQRPPGLPACLVDAVQDRSGEDAVSRLLSLAGAHQARMTLDQGVRPFRDVLAAFDDAYGSRMTSRDALRAQGARVAALTYIDGGYLLDPRAAALLPAVFAAIGGDAPPPPLKESAQTGLRALAARLRGR
jgi:hypothetical protein